MVSAGIIKNLRKPVKILGEGDLSHQITVKANKFSQTAKSKIEALGGKAEVIA
jgi:large subunit ribosomal protein L15